MKRGLIIIGIGAAVGVFAPGQPAMAQRLRPLPRPPVSLSVPHQIPPISISPAPPGDLYHQLTPPLPMPPTVVYTPGVVYGPAVYMPSSPSTNTMPKSDAPEPAARGGLRFETSPGSAQIYVDGFYAGVVDDFGVSGREVALKAGPHRVELRAPGYATILFAVNITANETARYRGDMARLVPTPAPAIAAPPLKTTLYVIPNCYAGDRPPMRTLPSGCSLARMLVR